MQKIDSKMIAAIALILGLIIGFYVDNALIGKPRIDSLTQTISEQNTTIINLSSQFISLENDYNSLQTQYDQLYAEYQEQNEDLENTFTELETQINSLLSYSTTLEEIIIEKNINIIDLEEQLDTLQRKYVEINNPFYTAFTIEDLNINLTVTTDSYRDNSPLTGAMIIKHTDGTPFIGSFKLSLIKVYPNIGTPSDYYDIQGSKTFSWNNPFVLGAGSYKLALSEVKDSLGNVVLTSNQLKLYGVYLFLG